LWLGELISFPTPPCLLFTHSYDGFLTSFIYFLINHGLDLHKYFIL